VLKTQEGHNERLIAFVVPKVSANDNELVPAFHRFSRERLPTYMVPAEFVILESLPLSPNGKVDRSALLSLDRHCDAATVAVVEGGEPKSELEKEIAPLICEALGIESVGVDTDFFEVGGDSLKAVQVVAKLGVQLGVSLPMDDFFEARTLRAISVRVARLVEERDSAR
jgi:acyl carrier protein